MAKRFIDTGLFDDEWFAELDPECKLFWIYYLTKCDHAGLLKYNKKLIEFQTGIKSLERVIEVLGKRLVRVTEQLLFCPKFIAFQYPGFPKSGVKQQEGAIKMLISSGLWDEEKSEFKDLPNSSVSLNEVLPKTYVYVSGNGNGNGNVVNENLKTAFDDMYLDAQRIQWKEIDFDFELKAFRQKVLGSPDQYRGHDVGGLRLAFQFQLRNAKKKQSSEPKNKYKIQ